MSAACCWLASPFPRWLAPGAPPPARAAPVEGAGHNTFRGSWTTRCEAQVLIYDPAYLAQVAAGNLPAWRSPFYVGVTLGPVLFHKPAGVEADMLGTGVQRRYRLGDVADDQSHGGCTYWHCSPTRLHRWCMWGLERALETKDARQPGVRFLKNGTQAAASSHACHIPVPSWVAATSSEGSQRPQKPWPEGKVRKSPAPGLP